MFKVGDTARVVDPILDSQEYLKGHIFKITSVIDCADSQHCYEGERMWLDKELELIEVNKMTKKDLKNGDIVTLRNGDRLVLCDECFNDLSGDYSNHLYDLDELRDDLTYKAWDDDSSSDIVKVERPVKYETVFERREEVKELTVDEISEKLGYKVKVVGVDK